VCTTARRAPGNSRLDDPENLAPGCSHADRCFNEFDERRGCLADWSQDVHGVAAGPT
jgi:hypothetical protein